MKSFGAFQSDSIRKDSFNLFVHLDSGAFEIMCFFFWFNNSLHSQCHNRIVSHRDSIVGPWLMAHGSDSNQYACSMFIYFWF